MWSLDLQPPMQSLHITTKVVSSNPAHSEVYSIQHYVIKFISNLQQVWFSPGSADSSSNKTDRHDITNILLKVTLKTITLWPYWRALHMENELHNCIYICNDTFIFHVSMYRFYITYNWRFYFLAYCFVLQLF